MKIDQTRIDPLLQQEQAQKKPAATGKGGFDELLGLPVEDEAAAALMPPPGASAAFDPRFAASAEASGGVSAADALSAAAFLQDETANTVASLDGLLSELDTYTRELNSGGNTQLRSAYNRLDGIESRLHALKADPASARLLSDNNGLASIVNEMEVLATTEKFKFNRGDYL